MNKSIQKPPDYGIIYNWDGAPHSLSEVPQSVNAFLEKTYAPLEDTQVGALFWCISEHGAKWESNALEMLGDIHGRRYERAWNYVHVENMRQMLERGEDPYPSLIARGHEIGLHVYASVRMNDNHFDGAQISDLPTLHHTELTELRRDHPEWLLGEETSDWFALSWNFSVPEVREHRFAHVKEIAERYRWDGVELDWQRHGYHLPTDDGYRLRYVLTDLQRAIRSMTNNVAQERGRPFYLAARVNGNIEMARRLGYDLPVWINEGLVDILILGGSAGTDPSPDVETIVEMCKNTEIAVYPGFDGGIDGTDLGPESQFLKSQMRTRAVANRWHQSGADGIYVFNWHATRNSRRELLSEIGSPSTLVSRDKIYAATYRVIIKEGAWRGAYRNDRPWGEVPVALKTTLTGDGPSVTLKVADDLSGNKPEEVELRIRIDQWVPGDEIAVKWDGEKLPQPIVRYSYTDMPKEEIYSDVSDAAWLSWELNSKKVSLGPHTVQVILENRNPHMACDIVLTDVELVIRYDSKT